MAFFSDIIDAFTGKSQRRDLEQGAQQAQQARQAGLNQFQATTQAAQDQALGYVRPDFQRGEAANRLISMALGLEGREPQTQFFEGFQTDPGFQESVDYGIRSLDRSAASRGRLASGAQLRAVSDFAGTRLNDAFNRRIEQLLQLGRAGTTAGVNAANLVTGQQGEIAGAQFGTGQQQAADILNLANARAQSRSVPINNLIEIGKGVGQAVAAAGGIPLPSGGGSGFDLAGGATGGGGFVGATRVNPNLPWLRG